MTLTSDVVSSLMTLDEGVGFGTEAGAGEAEGWLCAD